MTNTILGAQTRTGTTDHFPRVPVAVALDADAEIAAILEGGPANLPAELRQGSVRGEVRKIKVAHLGGYEHFERGEAVVIDGLPVVFQWTGRTRIAE